MDFFKNLFADGHFFDLAAQVIAAASIVANVTKTDRDNRAVGVAGKIFNFFALNFRGGTLSGK